MAIRSFLFVPGDSERKLAKGKASAADALILDLEDAVAPARKPLARAMVAEYLAAHATDRAPELWVRINPLDEGGIDDLAAVVRAAPDGIVVPKTDGPADVQDTKTLLLVPMQHCHRNEHRAHDSSKTHNPSGILRPASNTQYDRCSCQAASPRCNQKRMRLYRV